MLVPNVSGLYHGVTKCLVELVKGKGVYMYHLVAVVVNFTHINLLLKNYTNNKWEKKEEIKPCTNKGPFVYWVKAQGSRV